MEIIKKILWIILHIATCGISLIIKLEYIKQKEIKENGIKTFQLFEAMLKELDKEGVESVSLSEDEKYYVPKSETVYAKFKHVDIIKRKILKSGTEKRTIHGSGLMFVTNKAIICEISPTVIQSGKRRLLYKNFEDANVGVIPSRYGINFFIRYNKVDYFFENISKDVLRGIAIAKFLSAKDLKASDSISF